MEGKENNEMSNSETTTVQMVPCENCAAFFAVDGEDINTATKLCTNCMKWYHMHCVSKKAFGNKSDKRCQFCTLMSENSPYSELETTTKPRTITMRKDCGMPNSYSSEIPNGDPNDWKYFWNVSCHGLDFKLGDVVYLKRSNQCPTSDSTISMNEDCDIFRLTALFKDVEGEAWGYGYHYRKPTEIQSEHNQRFYPKELFECPEQSGNVKLKFAVSHACVLHRYEYERYRPLNFQKKDIFVYDSRYSDKIRKQTLIKRLILGIDHFFPNIHGYASEKYDDILQIKKTQVIDKKRKKGVKKLYLKNVPALERRVRKAKSKPWYYEEA